MNVPTKTDEPGPQLQPKRDETERSVRTGWMYAWLLYFLLALFFQLANALRWNVDSGFMWGVGFTMAAGYLATLCWLNIRRLQG